MKVVVAVQDWPSDSGPVLPSREVATAVTKAWMDTAPQVEVEAFAVGDGGPRSADALVGRTHLVGGSASIRMGETHVLSPRESSGRWNPQDLASALLGLAAQASAARTPATVVVPVGDESPAGDATELWGGGLAAFRSALAPLTVIVLVTASRPLLGFHGMSSALRDGREGDHVIGAAAQAQELRWSAVALDADAVVGKPGLIGPARLSDVRGSGAAGGLAYCLAAAGGRLTPASAYLFGLSGAAEAAAHADLVVAVTGPLTPAALDHGLVVPAAAAAAARAVPCIALSAEVQVGKRDLMAAGIASAYDTRAGLTGLTSQVARVAQTWTPER
jgi:glycerate kinase